MGYDLKASNKAVGWFHFGAFSWLTFTENLGYLFPVIQKSAQWYCVWGADERMPVGDTYPRLIGNDGMRITADEARTMARMARNYVAVQRSLTPETQGTDCLGNPKWPQKTREDFVDKIEAFAEWAEKSRGFTIH